ncbi:MAG: acetyl ornithine aminotransferase family protein [Candidatus Aenigmarchaeota archaeon]|nr:acetyl ornithine aminotransferase family protein [Candidatus Aenigmarchaeota archaeon]
MAKKPLKSESILKRDSRVISPSYTRSYPLVIERGKGIYIWDVDGKRYLDFTSGIAVANVGHSNPEVVKAIRSQTEKILHNAGTDFYNEPAVALAEKLCEITPGSFSKKVFFANSGTETVECAFKLARWYTKKPRMISFLGAFHGRTFGSMTLSSSKLTHRDHFSPLVPGVDYAPFPYCYRCPLGKKEKCEKEFSCLSYLGTQILKKVVPQDELAGIIVEPIQGEGGYIVPPDGFHKELQKLCREEGCLYIMDEVQTGFARTGKMFASHVFGVEPDIICVSKAIADGLPLGACVAKSEIMSWPRGAHANTFGGNPLACVAGLTVIDYIQREKLYAKAEKLGEFGKKYLKDLMQEHKIIGDVRGKGLMLAAELVKDRKTKKPAFQEVEKIVNTCFKNGLLLLTCGYSTVRFIPPLIIERDEFERGLEIFADTLK